MHHAQHVRQCARLTLTLFNPTTQYGDETFDPYFFASITAISTPSNRDGFAADVLVRKLRAHVPTSDESALIHSVASSSVSQHRYNWDACECVSDSACVRWNACAHACKF